MKQPVLHRLANQVLGERLAALGFQRHKGVFYRELPSKVIWLLMIGLDARTTETFQVLIGLNSRIISDNADVSRMGLIAAQHVAQHGLHYNSAHWPCTDESTARESLSQIAELINTVIEPWFEQRKSATDLANEMDAIQHGLRKAALYKADGDLTRASRTLEAYRERLSTPRPWDDPTWLATQEKAVDLLFREINKAMRTA
ncbi:MAG: hypothetical protein ACLP9L_36070 [Thermoguttaceae bacterium]